MCVLFKLEETLHFQKRSEYCERETKAQHHHDTVLLRKASSFVNYLEKTFWETVRCQLLKFFFNIYIFTEVYLIINSVFQMYFLSRSALASSIFWDGSYSISPDPVLGDEKQVRAQASPWWVCTVNEKETFVRRWEHLGLFVHRVQPCIFVCRRNSKL